MSTIRIIDNRNVQKFFIDDEYVDSFAETCGWKATVAYMALCRFAGRDQACFPKITTLAKKMAVSKNTIIAGLKALEEAGIIEVERTKDECGKQVNNVYYLLDKSAWKQESRVPIEDSVPSPCRVPIRESIKEPQSLSYNLLTNVNKLQNNENEVENVPKPADEVNQVLKILYEINPLLNFANLTERKAAQNLIDQVGIDRALSAAAAAKAAHGQPYAPSITTAVDLKNKYSKLEAFYKSRVVESTQKKNKVFISELEYE